MKEDDAGEITVLLQQMDNDVPGARDRFFKHVYADLRDIAAKRIIEAGAAFEPTTIVQAYCVRQLQRSKVSYKSRHHFFWAAARAMRDILVERARRDKAIKRGGKFRRIEFDDLADRQCTEADEIIALDEALLEFESIYPDEAAIVILRFFGGLTRENIAQQLGTSEGEVWRAWDFAKPWLHARINGMSDR